MPSLRKLSRREAVLVTLLGVVIVALTTWWLWPAGSSPLVRRSDTGPAAPPIPRVDLARLDAPRPDGDAGRRNLFDYGSPPAPVAAPAPPVVVATPPPAERAGRGMPGMADGAGGPAVPSLPPLNVKYIGSVENAAGVKVAVLVTDRQEVLTGQPGQVIANRYRIARIGLESVDLEDVSTGQSRRVPLRGS
jgi:hypothetical protein